jgi:hypothetical protein
VDLQQLYQQAAAQQVQQGNLSQSLIFNDCNVCAQCSQRAQQNAIQP